MLAQASRPFQSIQRGRQSSTAKTLIVRTLQSSWTSHLKENYCHHYIPDREPAPYTEISDNEEDIVVNIADHDLEKGHSESAVIFEHHVGHIEDFDVIGVQEVTEMRILSSRREVRNKHVIFF